MTAVDASNAAAAAEQEPEHTELASFLCPYFGAVKVKTDGHVGEDGEVIEPTCIHFLVLQDLCNGLDNPCALDVKMGRVTVEPGEREVSSKRNRSRSRNASNSSSSSSRKSGSCGRS